LTKEKDKAMCLQGQKLEWHSDNVHQKGAKQIEHTYIHTQALIMQLEKKIKIICSCGIVWGNRVEKSTTSVTWTTFFLVGTFSETQA
jgi:hypothetical protein